MPQLSVSTRPIDGPSAWVGCNVQPEAYRVELSVACHDEIRRAIDEMRAFPLPTIVLVSQDFAMPACREQMARVWQILDRGVRFAIVTGCPCRDGYGRGDGHVLASVEHGFAPGRAKARRHADLRCARYRATALPAPECARQDQHRDPLSQRQRLQQHAPRLCRSALSAPGDERRNSRVISFHSTHNALL